MRLGRPFYLNATVVSARYLLQHGRKTAANASKSQHTYAYTERLLGTLTRRAYISAQLRTQGKMADRIAKAVRCMGEDDFDLFGASDRSALMDMISDYFVGDDPEEVSSGKPRL